MNKFKLMFTETVSIEHEVIVETGMEETEFEANMENMRFERCDCIEDCLSALEEELEVEIKEITHSDPEMDNIDCDDIEFITGDEQLEDE